MGDDEIGLSLCRFFNYGKGGEHGGDDTGDHLCFAAAFKRVYRFLEGSAGNVFQYNVNDLADRIGFAGRCGKAGYA